MRADYREKLGLLQKRLRPRVEAASRRLRAMDLRTAISLGFIAVGTCLLVYVSWNYASMYLEQRELARRWQEQQQAALMHPVSDKTPAPKVSWDDGLTRLTVPKIGLDAIVVEGTNYHDLKLGPGHLKDTPAPGDEGNSVISGHRDTFFRHVHELEKGDEVLVQRAGRTYRYEVTGKKIVDPQDTWVASKTKDAELTLITCYPTYYIGPAPNRLVVFTKLIGEQPESATVKTAAAAQ
ncbi:MAG: class D sortase [Terriglobales bacterium]